MQWTMPEPQNPRSPDVVCDHAVLLAKRHAAAIEGAILSALQDWGVDFDAALPQMQMVCSPGDDSYTVFLGGLPLITVGRGRIVFDDIGGQCTAHMIRDIRRYAKP